MKLYNLPAERQEPRPYSFSTNLDGSIYSFTFSYNKRTDTYHFSVIDIQGNSIISNIPCLSYVEEMTTKYAIPDLLPFGDIYIAATSGDDREDPNFATFNSTIECFYMSIADDL